MAVGGTLDPPGRGGCADVATTTRWQVPEIGSTDQARVEAERLPDNATGEGALANDSPFVKFLLVDFWRTRALMAGPEGSLGMWVM